MSDRQRTIKSYMTKTYEVELFQDEYGRYCVRYEVGGHNEYSEWITDFGTASYIFDLKIQDLEGH